MFTNRLLVIPSTKNARKHSTAPVSIAAFAETIPFSRSRPAGNAIPAWNTAQMLTSQNVWVSVQPCWCSRVFSAAPKPYSNTLTPIMASQGIHIIQDLDLPISCSGDCPT
jgi:hypothetical protein